MHIFFVDDSAQKNPTRPKMGHMVGVGGFVVQSSHIHRVEQELDQLCEYYRFPPGEVFKWSPGNEHWMRENLIGNDRECFQIEVIKILTRHECKAVFIAEDKGCSTAENSPNHEIDTVKLLIERVDWYFGKTNTHGTIISDRPGGNYKKEEAFLLSCLETLKTGTGYCMPSNIIMSVLTSPFRLTRLLQAADLITSCTMAYVCGESRYSPQIFSHINPLFIREAGRVGGVGIKLHPFLKYGNFYHWLFSDTHYLRNNTGYPLPLQSIAFAKNIEQY